MQGAQRLVGAPYHPALGNDAEKLEILVAVFRLEERADSFIGKHFAIDLIVFRQQKVQGKNAHFRNQIGQVAGGRSEEHTSELQSRGHLVCRLLLEKKTT